MFWCYPYFRKYLHSQSFIGSSLWMDEVPINQAELMISIGFFGHCCKWATRTPSLLVMAGISCAKRRVTQLTLDGLKQIKPVHYGKIWEKYIYTHVLSTLILSRQSGAVRSKVLRPMVLLGYHYYNYSQPPMFGELLDAEARSLFAKLQVLSRRDDDWKLKMLRDWDSFGGAS